MAKMKVFLSGNATDARINKRLCIDIFIWNDDHINRNR